MIYERIEKLYDNPLSATHHIEGFVTEGSAVITFPNERLRLQNRIDESAGQAANVVLWCPDHFPDDIEISWDFYPLRDPGLCMMFFAAKGRRGENVFDPSLAKRAGIYGQYHSGDIDALHVSYFRRKAAKERVFNICNLRKSYGFHLVAQGADPLPAITDAKGPYRIRIAKSGPRVQFGINHLTLFDWCDDGLRYGPILQEGQIGFRQMAPMLAEYANLTVYRIKVR